MKKSSSYYTEGIKRKLSAVLFDKGLIKNSGQREVVEKLVNDVSYPISAKFNSRYNALNYLEENYKDSLNFQNGIAISELDGKENPLTPAIYALHSYNKGDNEIFELHLEYLIVKMQTKGDQYFWEYKNDLSRFEIIAPWVSGISQAVISSVMLRKYHESSDEKYLNIAKGAIAYCLDPSNGLKTTLLDGYWIEEYPSEKGKGVLNGFQFFLIALTELASFGFYKSELDEAMKGLFSMISIYHEGIYLKYASNISDLCNPWYDKIHYHQLNALYELTDENAFLKLIDYWQKTSSTDFKT